MTKTLIALLIVLVAAGTTYANFNPHPRLLLTPERLSRIQAKAATGTDDDFLRLKATADYYIATGKNASNIGSDSWGTILLIYASMYKATGEKKYLDATIASMDIHYSSKRIGPNWPTTSLWPTFIPAKGWGALGNYMPTVMYVAIAYDWIYDELTATYPEKKAQYKSLLEEYANQGIRKAGDGKNPDISSIDAYTLFQGSAWTNYTFRWLPTIAAIGYALAEDSPILSAAYLAAANERFAELAPNLQTGSMGDGGGSLEGSAYGMLQDGMLHFVELSNTAGGPNYYTPNEAYFKGRARYLAYLFHWWDFGGGAYPFRLGDFSEYGHITGYAYKDQPVVETLILMDRYPSEVGADMTAIVNASTKYVGMGSTKGSVTDKNSTGAFWDLIYRNQSITPTNIASIPKYYVSPGTGEVIVKSNLTEKNSVSLHFKSGNHIAYHEHQDANSFQISAFGGEFALHSGNYSQARDSEQINYSMRTVANNGMLIYDPVEHFRELRGGDIYNNDGGQRGYPYAQSAGGPTPLNWGAITGTNKNVYKTGIIEKIEVGQSYAYMVGDATNAYNNDNFISNAPDGKPVNLAKVTKVERNIVFLMPSVDGGETYIVMLDRVNVPPNRYSILTKKWLIHSNNKPVIAGPSTQIAGDANGGIWEHKGVSAPIYTNDMGARLFQKTILPTSVTTRLIGGTGYEQYSDGVNYPTGRTRLRAAPDGSAPAGSKAFYGQWRIELEPTSKAENDLFLNVFQPTRSTMNSMSDTGSLVVTSGNISGVWIKDADKYKVVVMSANPSGDPLTGAISYALVPEATNATHHIFNLTPGSKYDVAIDNQHIDIIPGTQHTVSQAGSIVFTATHPKPKSVLKDIQPKPEPVLKDITPN